MKLFQSFRPLWIVAFSLATVAGVPVGSAPNPAQGQAGTDNRQQPPAGTIRVRVNLVPVDVIVTDAYDRPVTDLKREDFQIFEDGHPQEIRHFAIQQLAASAPEADRGSPLRAKHAEGMAPPTGRAFLIFFMPGCYNIPFRSVDAILRFVQDDLLPQDLVAVWAYNRTSDFTTGHEKIVHVLERFRDLHEELQAEISNVAGGLGAIYTSERLLAKFQPKIDRIFGNDEGLGFRKLPPGWVAADGTVFTELERSTKDAARRLDRLLETSERSKVADQAAAAGGAGAGTMQSLLTFDRMEMDLLTASVPFDEFAELNAETLRAMKGLFSAMEYLRYMEGGRHLIFFSPGGLTFLGGDRKYDEAIAALANYTGVTIDMFRTGGLKLNPAIVSARGPMLSLAPVDWAQTFSVMSQKLITNLTGGRAAVFEDIGKALDKLDETTRVEYLLGYYPDNAHLDGKYRDIQVKVNRPGVKVSFRHGYFASERIQPADPEESLARSRILGAGSYDLLDLQDVPFEVNTQPGRDADGRLGIRVDLKIDAAGVAFKTSQGRYTARLRIAVFYADGRRHYLGENWQAMNLQLKEETHRRYLRSGIPFSLTIPHQSPQQVLKVIVYDVQSDKVGVRMYRNRW